MIKVTELYKFFSGYTLPMLIEAKCNDMEYFNIDKTLTEIEQLLNEGKGQIHCFKSQPSKLDVKNANKHLVSLRLQYLFGQETLEKIKY
jgi:hypothetical protein